MTKEQLPSARPILPPFPRPNHLSLLRQERTRRRRRRFALTAALTACIAATGGTVAAATVAPETLPRAAAEVSFATDDPRAVLAATSVLDDAAVALDDAADGVDTEQLGKYVDTLSRYDKLPAVVVTGMVDEVAEETEQVQAATASAEAKAAEEAAAEAAAQAEAEAEAAAAALAAANTPEGAQEIARTQAAEDYGWGDDQFGCLVSLWDKESGWSHTASNPSSGAYGIPQSLPGSKMSSAGEDWETNAATQISWGLDYIAQVYGTPCGAWGHSQATDWY
jgi:murein DD-endopeptidase MepM/ murein hydrolase activator NlpD